MVWPSVAVIYDSDNAKNKQIICEILFLEYLYGL